MDLILQLRQEHVEIIRLFEIVDKSDVNQTNDLNNLREKLSTHLDLENKLIYPKIEKSSDKKIREIGKKFSDEMKAILPVVVKFFKKYENKPIKELFQDKVFKKEMITIVKTVKKRVKIKEDILFPKYEELILKKK